LFSKIPFNKAKIFSVLALLWIASGYFLPIDITINGREFQINAYPEFYLIPIFAIWRIRTEKDPFQKRRVLWMMGLFAIFFVTMPLFIRSVPLLDGSNAPLVASYHMVGSVSFFLFFIAVFLFGKRADCGWNCTCVFTRETVAWAFRDKTRKGAFWWNLRHLKWILFLTVWGFFIYMLIDPMNAGTAFGKPMYQVIYTIYYLSILLIPFTGHRNYCRWGCPWSATWGVLNILGTFRIAADTTKCTKCGICEKECDMGVPIRNLIFETGRIKTVECMGCERCVRKCPKGVLTIQDFRDQIPGFGLLPFSRMVRIVIGLPLILLPFISNHSILLFLALLGVLLVLSGILGYCPIENTFLKCTPNVFKWTKRT